MVRYIPEGRLLTAGEGEPGSRGPEASGQRFGAGWLSGITEGEQRRVRVWPGFLQTQSILIGSCDQVLATIIFGVVPKA